MRWMRQVLGATAGVALVLTAAQAAATEDGWSPIMRVQWGFGYDSNVPVLPEDNGLVSNQSSWVSEGGATAGALLKRDRQRFRVQGEAHGTFHEGQLKAYNLARLGGRIAWQHLGRRWVPSVTVHSKHYRLDNTDALWESGLIAGLAYTTPSWVGLARMHARNLDYDVTPGRTGQRYSLLLGAWWLQGQPARRWYVQCELGTHDAKRASQSYDYVQPELGWRWRWKRSNGHRLLESDVSIGVRREDYQAGVLSGEAEQSDLWQGEAELRYWFAERWWVDGSVLLSERDSNRPDRSYDRWRAMLSIGSSF